MPHGVLFRGNREADIRRNLVRRGLSRRVDEEALRLDEDRLHPLTSTLTPNPQRPYGLGEGVKWLAM